ncbi:MazG-like family protein [Clostridium thermarum]|uniref:MazG-like family protein n=1 Tax=Clostridium thermarum TaxID=1716543 RepID=UPI00111DEFE7|nr:MazG-like family protein [Clostridium thermarum]
MKRENFNIMSDIKIIEDLKAQLLCVIGEFYRLLTKGSNVAQEAILDSISGAIIILYILADRLGYSYSAVDENIQKKLKVGIIEEDIVEKQGKNLSRLASHMEDRMK